MTAIERSDLDYLEHFRFRVHSVCKQCDIPLALHQIEDRRIFYYCVSTLQHFNTKKKQRKKVKHFFISLQGLERHKNVFESKDSQQQPSWQKISPLPKLPKTISVVKERGNLFRKTTSLGFLSVSAFSPTKERKDILYDDNLKKTYLSLLTSK